MEDEQILTLFFARDETALSETREKYGPRLTRLARRFLSSAEDAEECVSDTYLKAWDTIPPQRPVHFFAYLATLCRRFALGYLDRQNAARRSAPTVALTEELAACLPGGGAAEHSDEALGALLNRFLHAQKPESRAIFLRRYWYADSVKDIAARFGVSESKVKASLHRTRKKLKDYLAQEDIIL